MDTFDDPFDLDHFLGKIKAAFNVCIFNLLVRDYCDFGSVPSHMVWRGATSEEQGTVLQALRESACQPGSRIAMMVETKKDGRSLWWARLRNPMVADGISHPPSVSWLECAAVDAEKGSGLRGLVLYDKRELDRFVFKQIKPTPFTHDMQVWKQPRSAEMIVTEASLHPQLT